MIRILLVMVFFVCGCARPMETPVASDLHARLLTLDAHLDTPAHFPRANWRFGEHHHAGSDFSQVDMPRMASGALDGGFFVIYTRQGQLDASGYADALAFARGRSDVIDTVLRQYPQSIAPALTAADAGQAAASGRLIAFKSMENSYPLGENLDLLDEFYRRGVRLAGPVHSSNNQFADSATDTPRWNGLSPLGREWVARMNRLGIVIDASHASDATFDQLLALSETPIILSHSGSRAWFNHPRNLDDRRIRALAASGGAICASTVYLSSPNMTEERTRLFEEMDEIGSKPPAVQHQLVARWLDLDAREPMWSAGFEDYMEMLLHVIDVAGVDHVCFGADWDGGGGIDGLRDITMLHRVTERLAAAGFTETQLAQMWSGNLLRILRAAERNAAAPGAPQDGAGRALPETPPAG